MSPGIRLITRERVRQHIDEGFTSERDDGYTSCELATAAMAYANAALIGPGAESTYPPEYWPWALDWWKPSDDPIRNLVKAGALIAAEIDRLQRAADRQADADVAEGGIS